MSAVGPAALRAATARALAGDARSRGTPLIDDGGATFVWLGGDPAPSLVGDWNDWDAGRGVSLERVGRGVHAARLSVPDDAYLEYQLQHGQRRAPDPLNRAPFPNGIGGINSCFWMPRAPRHDLARRRRGAPAGLITSHRIPTQGLAVGRHRAAWLYRPAVGTGPFPLLVVLDGRDYLRRGRLDRVLDNLIADGRIAPLGAVFVDNAGPARMVEYGATDTTVAFLAGVVVPFAARHLDASLPADWAAEPSTSGPWELVAKTGVPGASPGPVGILGASMGGLMALHAALRLPGLFGRVLAQSGAWDAAGHDSSTKALVRNAPPTPIRVWMDCGRIEWLYDTNERMAALLDERGYDVAYRVYQGGHNYRCWVQDVVGGLALLYPPEDTPGAR